MRILFIGDPHIRPDNIQEIDQLEKTLDEVLKDNTIDFIVVGGDILHTHERLHTIAMNRAIDFIKHLSDSHRVYCLVGNHDLINNQQFMSRNHWMAHLHLNDNVTIVQSAIRVEDVVMVPYVWPGRFVEAMEVSGVTDWRSASCIFAHQEFKGCKMGAIVSEIGDEWKDDWPFVVSGHIHDNQRPQKNIYYPGTPIQHSFGDVGKNVVAIVTVEDGSADVEEVYTGCSSKKTVATTLEKIEDLDLAKYDGSQVRVTIAGDATNLKVFQKSTKFKELQKAGVKIALRPVAVQMEEVREVVEENSDFLEILKSLVDAESGEQIRRDFRTLILGYSGFEIE
jgi:DNA repair exonuclease SbcCD nuclease subunit